MTGAARFELAPGYSISRIINGCWQLTPDHGGGPGSERETLRIFADLVDHGFTTFDCADIYIGVERMLGRFRRGLADPDAIQIHTKYAPDREALHLLTDRQIDDAVDRSLRRLKLERLDLLQFHWWNYEVPGLDTVLERLVRAQEAGKIRLLGVTNFDTPHVRDMILSGVRLVSVQAQYSLLDRRPERALTDLAGEHDIRILSYGALAGGFLADKYLGRPPPERMNRSLQKYRLIIDEIGGWDVFQQLLGTLSDIAERYETTIASVAARWALDREAVAGIILGTGSVSRAKHNASLARLELDDEDRGRITARLERQKVPAGDMYELERDVDGVHGAIIKMNLHDSNDSL